MRYIGIIAIVIVVLMILLPVVTSAGFRLRRAVNKSWENEGFDPDEATEEDPEKLKDPE